ncbi:sodium pump decarboxylase gamma subunit [Aequitasia blattaphilus]|uniref:OadG family transporter subunit n=1 Tax=Aequitasia blattaphilus TaxID=2949332 RepID=A0ABT1E5V6_9FIRM|nr:OadG family transporter subunit [Aequitasia blattaphilus]MCP1101133.1 OadG family transporter subunit [Aequitasia blattaphilus]MCR8613773.1 OadG family transporter subunit [Aequitasia blattaphilus]
MKKKISLVICMLLFALCFTGCSNQKETMEYDKENLTQIADALLEQVFPGITEEGLEQIGKLEDFSFQYQLLQTGLPLTPATYMEAGSGWLAAQEECGAYVSHGDYTFEDKKDSVVVSTEAQFEDRGATIAFTFDKKSYLETMTVSADYTTGEVMTKAGLNTLLGMGTVFTVLIFISLIISLLKYVPLLFERKKKTTAVPKEENVVEDVAAPEAQEVVADDSELIAVIAAAISAAEGISQDGFVVRSIKRRPGNKWRKN